MLCLKNIEMLLKKCFYLAFAVFPLSIALVMGGRHFAFGTYEELTGTDTLYNWPVLSMLFVAVCIAAVFVFYKKGWDIKLFQNSDHRKLALIILLFAVAVRLAFFAVFESVLIPFSDGNHVWVVAHTNDEIYLNLKSIQNGWNNFMGIVVFLVRTFNVPYPAFIFVQFVVDGLTAFAVFKLAYEAFEHKDIAFWAGLFYAVNPSALMRMFYFSPECYSLLCLTFAAYFFILLVKTDLDKKMYIYALTIGVLLGIGNSLKSISIIFIVAVVIIIVLKAIAGEVNKKRIVSWALAMALIVVPAFGVNKVALKATTMVTGVEARDLLLYHQLNVGLNPYGYGNTGEDNAWYYTNLVRFGTDAEVAKEMLAEKLKTDWKETGTEVLPWLLKKVEIAWTESTAEFTLLMKNSISMEHNKIQHYAYILLLNIATSSMQLSYILLMLFSVIGTIFIAIRYIKNDGAFLVSLYVFGFSLLMLIIECKPRYKANIISFVVVLAAVGLSELMKKVSLKTTDKKNAELNRN